MFVLSLKCENLYLCVKYYKNSEIVNQVVKIYILSCLYQTSLSPLALGVVNYHCQPQEI